MSVHPVHSTVYWGIGKALIGTFTRAMIPIKVYGRERVPREGGAVLAVNHFSYADPPAMGVACPRRIVFVAKVELHGVYGFGQLLRAHGTLAVRRGESDRDALRRMRETVRNNDLLGLFVEGTRQKAGVPGEAKSGAAMVAIQEGAPIVPVAIHGTQTWSARHPTRVSIAWGEPLALEGVPKGGKGYKEASVQVEHEIRRLWDWLVALHEQGRRDGAVPPGAGRP